MADDSTSGQDGGYSDPMAQAMMLGFLGGGRGQQMMNPAMIMPEQTMALGQALGQLGSQTTPVASPWQAAARAVQGMLGGWYGHQARQQFGDILAGQNQQFQDFNRQVAQAMAPSSTAMASAQQQQQQPQQAPAPVQSTAPSQAQSDFAAKMMPYAKRAGQALNVDPNIILAQWAHETGWGTNRGATQLNNFAGITQPAGGPGGDRYASYATPDEFTNAYIGLVGGGKYKGAVGAGADANKFVDGLKAGGYFEDSPENYAGGVNKALASLSGQSVPSYTVAQNAAAPTASTPEIGPGPEGYAKAQQLRMLALQAAESYDPRMKAMAPMLMQQAVQVQNLGLYQTVRGPGGLPMQVNTITGKMDPLPQPSAETYQHQDDAFLAAHEGEMKAGTASDQVRSAYVAALQRRYPFEMKEGQVKGQYVPVAPASVPVFDPRTAGGGAPAGVAPSQGPTVSMPKQDIAIAQHYGAPLAPGSPYGGMDPVAANKTYQDDRAAFLKDQIVPDRQLRTGLQNSMDLLNQYEALAQQAHTLSDNALGPAAWNTITRDAALKANPGSPLADVLQRMDALEKELIPQMRAGAGITRVTNKDMEIFEQMVPDETRTLAANQGIINNLRQKVLLQKDFSDYKMDDYNAGGTGRDLEHNWDAYYAANPVTARDANGKAIVDQNGVPVFNTNRMDRRSWMRTMMDDSTGQLHDFKPNQKVTLSDGSVWQTDAGGVPHRVQ